MRTLARCLALSACVLCCMSPPASAQVFNFSSGDFSAKATFTVVGTDLQILFQNTSSTAAANSSNADVLTSLFFDVQGDPNLTTGSTIALANRFDGGGTSTIVNGTLPAGETLGQHWAYKEDIVEPLGAPSVGNYGISAVGLGIFGTANAFDPATGNDINGDDYGLSGISTPGAQTGPQVWDSVLVTLKFASTPGLVSNVRFQYGSTFNTQTDGPPGGGGGGEVPTPPAMLVMLAGGGAAWFGVLKNKIIRR